VSATAEDIRERLGWDTPYYAEHCLQIVDKHEKRVPLTPKPAQIALDAKLEAQRQAGHPQRAIVLKARQVGISTWVQAKLLQKTTQRANRNALVVAHDRDTGAKLYLIGERMYQTLPEEVKPEIRAHGRARFLHFGERGADAWMAGSLWPDSTYFVDTAGEFQAGRGATYHDVHASEFAFWGQALTKHTGLMQTVPDTPESLVVIESTANGHNLFHDLWLDAEQGRSEYVPFFWPWWREDAYERRFLSDGEYEDFRVGEHELFGEDEPGLMELLGRELPDLTQRECLAKLNWRRWAIPNKCAGKLEVFHQEYPGTPEEAFLSTGARVFDGNTVRKVLLDVESLWDPRVPSDQHPGPELGLIRATDSVTRAARVGRVDVPTEPEFVPRSKLNMLEQADWRFWLSVQNGKLIIPPDRPYVVGADVSGGLPESGEGDPAYHTIEVIDHLTKVQVAEYRSRVDPDLFAEHLYLTALHFNSAWLAIEITGGWGLPIARKLWHDYRYPFLFMRKKVEQRTDREVDRLGWDTNRQTKPILLAGGQELLREDTHGLRSRRVLQEMLTYVKTENGQTQPEPGKFSDLLMAWLIVQQVALMLPIRQRKKKASKRPRLVHRARDPVTGY
jgi:hypothetical protein